MAEAAEAAGESSAQPKVQGTRHRLLASALRGIFRRGAKVGAAISHSSAALAPLRREAQSQPGVSELPFIQLYMCESQVARTESGLV